MTKLRLAARGKSLFGRKPTPGKAQTSSSRSLICCGSRSTAAWRATRTATTERAGLQPGQLVAAARTAEQDQELVADELATQVDEDRRSAGQARAVLLAAAGRRAFEPQAVRRHAAQDLGAAAAKRVALTGRGSTVFGSKRFRKEQCRPERRSARSINVCERTDEPWRLPAEMMCRVQCEKTWYSGQRGCILSPCQGQNGNPGFESHHEK